MAKRMNIFLFLVFTVPSRKKVKGLIRMGDALKAMGCNVSATEVYRLALGEARRIKTHHLLKALDKRLCELASLVGLPNP